MNNLLCAICGHGNREGAIVCEMCDARLDTDAWAGADDAPPADARAPFASTGEPSWTAHGASEPDSARPGSGAPSDEIPAPPFKGAGDVISPMLAVYRKHFTLVGLLVLVVAVPDALLQYSLLSATTAAFERSTSAAVTGIDDGSTFIVIMSGMLLWLLATTGAALLSGSLIHAVVDVQRAGRASAGECLKRGLKTLPMVFVVSLLYAIVSAIGYLLLIVPGVIVSLMFAVSVPAAIVEKLGPIEAMKRSRELTDGYKGLIFITFFLWWLLITVVSWVVGWSFVNNANLGQLPTLLLQTAILGMLTSTTHVLTAYIYLGLRREHRSAFQTHTFTPGPEVAAR